jgi:hypothetical protein
MSRSALPGVQLQPGKLHLNPPDQLQARLRRRTPSAVHSSGGGGGGQYLKGLFYQCVELAKRSLLDRTGVKTSADSYSKHY